MGRNDDTIDETNITDLFNQPARHVVTVDVERYKKLLDDPALSEADKENFLQALWSIVVGFVDLGFGVHPLQEVCDPEERSLRPLEGFDRAAWGDSNDKGKRGTEPTGGVKPE